MGRQFLVCAGEAFQVGFLADRALRAIGRYESHRAAEREAEALRQLESFLRDVDRGRSVALHKPQDKADYVVSSQAAAAFQYAVEAWKHLENRPAPGQMSARVKEYTEAARYIRDNRIEELPGRIVEELRSFLAVIGQSTLGEIRRNAAWSRGRLDRSPLPSSSSRYAQLQA